MDIALILPWLSIAATLVTINKFYQDKRKSAIDEGMMRQTIEQLKQDVHNANIKISCLEIKSQESEVDMAEVKRDIKHILEALARIESKLP